MKVKRQKVLSLVESERAGPGESVSISDTAVQEGRAGRLLALTRLSDSCI